jgi:hypothetical protein
MRVRIDGVETTLTYDCFSGARGYQYLTPGAASSHAFGEPLQEGTAFRTNGHRYEILRDDPYREPAPKPPCATCGGDQLVCSACGLPGATCKCPTRDLPTPRTCPECLPEYADL